MASAAMLSPHLFNQTGPPIRVRSLNHLAVLASDPEDSIDFYQGLFGMPIQARHGATSLLRVGGGPQFLAIMPANGGAAGMSHFCLGVDNFDADDLVATLTAHGLTKASNASTSLSGGALRVRVGLRGPEAGGSPDGTPHVYLGDPDGIVVQLQHPSYCGGASVLGNLCNAPEPADRNGLLSLRGLDHVAISAASASNSGMFYRSLFTLDAPFITLGAVDQPGPFPGAPRARGISHAALRVERLDVDLARTAFAGYGLKPVEPGVPAGPLRYYVDRRDLYFTDPDGILLKLQDAQPR